MSSMRLGAGGIKIGTTYGRIDSSNISMKEARLRREKQQKINREAYQRRKLKRALETP